jgi:hypothetical protein
MKGLKINVKLASQIPMENPQILEKEIENKSKSECSQISENIFISGYQVALDYEYLYKNNFTHILNCATGSKTFQTEIHKGIEYLLLDLKDDPGFDLIYAIYLTIDFIEKASNVGKILIHCVEVINKYKF